METNGWVDRKKCVFKTTNYTLNYSRISEANALWYLHRTVLLCVDKYSKCATL